MAQDYPKLLFMAGIACFVIALLAVLFFAIAPSMLGGGFPLQDLVPVAAMILIVLAGLCVLAAIILLLIEVATASNDGTWKALWLIAMLILGVIGMGLYLAIGRKDRKPSIA